jgi:hypothetical protein
MVLVKLLCPPCLRVPLGVSVWTALRSDALIRGQVLRGLGAAVRVPQAGSQRR